MNYLKKNSEAWDQHVENGYIWSVPVSSEIVQKAKKGKWEVVLTPQKNVPKSWFPNEIKGKKVLLIAGGGGQQGPILSAAGADVTVFDNSKKQLEQDEMVAKRENIVIKTVQGNMQDLSVLKDESFDFIMQFGGGFVDSVLPVWKEAYRVLKKGGIMVSGHNNPNECIFDFEEMGKGNLVVRHKIPYSDLTSLSKDEFERITADEGVFFGHSLQDLIQGQIDAGFLIAGFYEDKGGSLLDEYIPTYFATKAVKL
jgi:Methylase involved in ubiquinone/menaquinone biosynthesis